MRSQWDSMQDADQYWNALLDYANLRWGTPNLKQGFDISWQGQTEGFVNIKRNGNDILWLITPDQASADLMVAKVHNF